MGNRNAQNVNVLSEKELKLIQAKSQLTVAEILEWHEKFLSHHPSGYINLAEFVEIYQDLHPFGDASKYARLAFNAFDRDQSGHVSLAEYLMATCGVAAKSKEGGGDDKNHREQVIDLAFDIYDQNRNGTVERGEVEAVVQAIYDLEGFDATQAKSKVDSIFEFKNVGSGLTKEEFVNMIMNDPIMSRVFVYC